MNCLTTDGPCSSRETPTTTRPFSPYFFCSSMKPGISALQGGHHVAQKSRMTTLPSKSDDFTSLPSGSFNSQTGAFEELRASGADERKKGRRLVSAKAKSAPANRTAMPKLDNFRIVIFIEHLRFRGIRGAVVCLRDPIDDLTCEAEYRTLRGGCR